jgi:hypothetical protein
MINSLQCEPRNARLITCKDLTQLKRRLGANRATAFKAVKFKSLGRTKKTTPRLRNKEKPFTIHESRISDENRWISP